MHNETSVSAFCHITWRRHVAGMTGFSAIERAEIMEIVHKVEVAMCRIFRPAKINLTSLGSVVPHLY